MSEVEKCIYLYSKSISQALGIFARHVVVLCGDSFGILPVGEKFNVVSEAVSFMNGRIGYP